MKEKTNKQLGIKEIAKMAKVSIGTIDRVLHDRPGVSINTKTRVKKIIEEVGYNPNPIARRLAGFKNIYTIAVIIPRRSDFNPYWGEHLAGIEKSLALVEQFGVEVEPIFFDFNGENSFIEATKHVLENNYDAAVMAPLFQNASLSFANQCAEKNIPFVCIDTDLSHPQKLSFIGQNSYKSGFLAGKLASWRLSKGQKALICHITKSNGIPENLKKREDGFRNYLTEKAGFSNNQLLRLEINYESEAELKEKVQEILSKNETIQCLFIPNAQCFLVIKSLTEAQKTNIFIIGYDLITENIELLINDSIDVLINQKPVEQCYKAITLLYEKLIAKKTPVLQIDIAIDIIIKENIDFYLHENRKA